MGIFSSQLAFFHWARFIVFFFCIRYAVLHSSIFSLFPVFLAYLQCLLSFDLSSMLSVSSLSTQGAALKCCSLLPVFFLTLFLIVCSTEVFNLFIHPLKLCFFPYFLFKTF